MTRRDALRQPRARRARATRAAIVVESGGGRPPRGPPRAPRRRPVARAPVTAATPSALRAASSAGCATTRSTFGSERSASSFTAGLSRPLRDASTRVRSKCSSISTACLRARPVSSLNSTTLSVRARREVLRPCGAADSSTTSAREPELAEPHRRCRRARASAGRRAARRRAARVCCAERVLGGARAIPASDERLLRAPRRAPSPRPLAALALAGMRTTSPSTASRARVAARSWRPGWPPRRRGARPTSRGARAASRAAARARAAPARGARRTSSRARVDERVELRSRDPAVISDARQRAGRAPPIGGAARAPRRRRRTAARARRARAGGAHAPRRARAALASGSSAASPAASALRRAPERAPIGARVHDEPPADDRARRAPRAAPQHDAVAARDGRRRARAARARRAPASSDVHRVDPCRRSTPCRRAP